MVVKGGFSVFWWWLCREVLLFFERPLHECERPFWSKHLKNIGKHNVHPMPAAPHFQCNDTSGSCRVFDICLKTSRSPQEVRQRWIVVRRPSPSNSEENRGTLRISAPAAESRACHSSRSSKAPVTPHRSLKQTYRRLQQRFSSKTAIVQLFLPSYNLVFFGHRPIFLNHWKKLSHFGHTAWKLSSLFYPVRDRFLWWPK